MRVAVVDAKSCAAIPIKTTAGFHPRSYPVVLEGSGSGLKRIMKKFYGISLESLPHSLQTGTPLDIDTVLTHSVA